MKIYLIPGLGENCNEKQYKKLIQKLNENNHKVIEINPNWYKPLKEQLFKIDKNSILIGFSYGAIIAYLLGIEQKCNKIIFASISPIKLFSLKELISDYKEHMTYENAKILAKEIKSINIDYSKILSKYITLNGELDTLLKSEKKPDLIVPNTPHKITDGYINAIIKLL